MKPISEYEKAYEPKRRSLLYALRKNNWNIVGIENEFSDWALDEKWFIESVRENRGFSLVLWLYKYEGIHDGMDRVVATVSDESEPGPYSGTPAIEFDIKGFEKRLDSFIISLHRLRISKGHTKISSVFNRSARTMRPLKRPF